MTSAPTKKKVVIANPMQGFNRLNSNVPVTVRAEILVNGVTGANTLDTYFTKVQTFQLNNSGLSPGFLEITDVNLPTQGAYFVQVFLESVQCTVFPILPPSCSNTQGARAKYRSQFTQPFQQATPAGGLMMPYPINQQGACCN